MTRRGIVLFGLMAVIWGIPYLFIRVAVAEITPATLVFARPRSGTAILLPIAIVRVDLRPVLARWRWLVAFAAVEIAVPWLMLATAEQHISSSLTGLLMAGVPLVGTVLALATGGARPDEPDGASLGLLVGLVGVAAIVGADFAASDATAFLEVGVVIVVLCRSDRRSWPAAWAACRRSGVMSLSLGLTALVYLPFAATQLPAVMPSPEGARLDRRPGRHLHGLGFIVFAALIKEIGPVRSTVITYVNPAVAAVLGVVVLNETFTPGDGRRPRPRDPRLDPGDAPARTAADRRPPISEHISAAPAGGSNG